MSDRERKLAAKRHNEHMKLFASTVNTLSLTTFGAAVILPYVGGTPAIPTPAWILVALGLHLAAQAAIRFLKSED